MMGLRDQVEGQPWDCTQLQRLNVPSELLAPRSAQNSTAGLDEQAEIIDRRIQADLEAGHFDSGIRGAIQDEKNGRVRSL